MKCFCFGLIIQWFIIFQGPVDTFVQTYLGVGQGGENSENIYDLSKISRRLPSVSGTQEAINYLFQMTPSLIVNGRVFIYSPKMTDGIIYFLREYDKTTRGLTRPVPSEIASWFQDEDDFIQQPNVSVFIGEEAMRSWLRHRLPIEQNKDMIRQKLDISLGTLTDPYLYQSPKSTEGDLDPLGGSKIYLIQNVAGGDKFRAFQVVYQWYDDQINPGFGTLPWEQTELPYHAIYGISTGSVLVVIENHTEGHDNFLQLLAYGNNQYAAMLPVR